MKGFTTLQILNHQEGRFGNQLFRVATTIGQSLYNEVPYYIPAEWEHIHRFPVLSKVSTPTQEIKSNIKHVFVENGFHYQPIPLQEGITEIRGYVQSDEYFKLYKKEVLEALSFSDKAVEDIRSKYFSVPTGNLCIHVRHGDYYDKAVGGGHKGNEYYHPVMSLDYYNNAINYIISQRKVETIHIFTDHPETKNYVLGKFDKFGIPIKYVDYKNDYISDFIAQSICDYFIIPNSTFSWWSAYLSTSQDKLICCPRKEDWLGQGYSHLNKDNLLPQDWVQITQS